MKNNTCNIIYDINQGVHWMLHSENKSDGRTSKIIPQHTCTWQWGRTRGPALPEGGNGSAVLVL